MPAWQLWASGVGHPFTNDLMAELRKKAAKRELGYQTMLKMIVREHLDEYWDAPSERSTLSGERSCLMTERKSMAAWICWRWGTIASMNVAVVFRWTRRTIGLTTRHAGGRDVPLSGRRFLRKHRTVTLSPSSENLASRPVSLT
jgi:hypothetical protein